MARIAAVLLDKDGTLFDFQATWGPVVAQTLATLTPDAATQGRLGAAVGYDLATGGFAPGSVIVAGSLAQVAALWAPIAALPAPRIEAVIAAAGLRPARLVPACADLPGLLRGLRARGLPLGLATHDSAAAAEAHLAAAGVRDAFGFVAGYDSGHGLKPGPGMLHAFCAGVGVAPDAVAVVGDSVHDLGMARAGGALAVGVLTGPAGAADLRPLADHILASIADLPALLDTLAG